MSPAIFAAALVQETNVFGPLPTGIQSFSGRFTVPGLTATGAPPFPEALLANLQTRAVKGELRLKCGPVAGAHPSGRVTRSAYELLRDAILTALDAAGPVDIVALHLHGAMMADHYSDCEGDLLTRIRSMLGPKPIIGALLDPHAHLSAEMLRAADLLVAYKEYPHTDFRERANELIELMLVAERGEVQPHAALWDTGAIGIFHTNLPEVRALVTLMQSWENTGQALTASLIHGFPWGDCPDLGTRALVITDGESERADELALALANAAQSVAINLPPHTTPLRVALRGLAKHYAGGPPVVWADSADNPGGGAAGDSTYVLAALLEHGIEDACLGPLWDPTAVGIAFNAGVGARLPMRVGGKTGPMSAAPLDVDAEVLALCEDASQTFAGSRFPLGRAAALRCAGVEIIVTSERDQARGTDLFTNLHIRPEKKRLVIVKSSQHFYESFAKIAGEVIYLDCPGSLQANLRSYSYQQICRPRWPIDASPPAAWRVGMRSRSNEFKEFS